MAAFNKKLQVAEQDRSLRVMTRLIVPGADHDQPRRRHLSGELYPFTDQEATSGVDDGSAYAQRHIAHQANVQEETVPFAIRRQEANVTSNSYELSNS
jgi:hypothetical protein